MENWLSVFFLVLYPKMSSLRKARSMNFVVGKKNQQSEEEHKPRIRNVTTTTFIPSTTSTSNPFKDAAKKVLRRKTPIDEVKNSKSHIFSSLPKFFQW